MKPKHWLRKAALYAPDHLRLPWWKPKHLDRLRRDRMVRNVHIDPTPPRRQSFKRFWREHAAHPALRGKPRRWRRVLVLNWYRAEKRDETF